MMESTIMVFLKDGLVTIGGTQDLLFFSSQLLVCLLHWLASSELVCLSVLVVDTRRIQVGTLNLEVWLYSALLTCGYGFFADSLRYTSALSVALAVVFLVITAGISIMKLISGGVAMPRLLPDVTNLTSFWNLFTVVPVLVTAFICHYNGMRLLPS